ncbi:hypothetical protein EWM64_g10214 [Hericium alpestre]|uniref:HNH nuclease domain-containing protein n=1 Tax=Hericium alpestre TaxID=135208 RepID=A0A4Y9ZIE6_9AGAM|nr:hypothetical protein EWM64_g10214 [Hericium alpestre]
MPQSLPAFDNLDPNDVRAYSLDLSDLSLRTAYDTCLWLESFSGLEAFATNLEHDRSHSIMTDMSSTLSARVLGYALLYAHSQAGRGALIREINECNRDLELLAGLAHLYVFGLIRVFRNPKGPTPDISSSQSPRHSFQQALLDAEHLLQKTSFTAAELRKLVNLFACISVHSPIYKAAFDINTATSTVRESLSFRPQAAAVQVAHIISQSLSEGIEGVTPAARAKFDWARTASAIIERFGDFNSRALLGDWGLNSPLNAFLSTNDSHAAFDALEMWLTPAKTSDDEIKANTYNVNVVVNHQLLPSQLVPDVAGVRNQVKFEPLTVGSQVIPAPHPELIGLHAACAEIAHRSGAAEYLEEFFRGIDSISVMTEPDAAYELTRSLKVLQLVRGTA